MSWWATYIEQKRASSELVRDGKANPNRVMTAALRIKGQILKVSKRVRVRADLGSVFPFGPALRPNSHGVALFKLGQKKWALHKQLKIQGLKTYLPLQNIIFCII